MSRKGWFVTSEGMMWANGHWQSGGNGSGGRKWSPDSGCLYKVEKGGVSYYPAPSYCVLNNGAMELYIYYNRNYTASMVAGIDISEEQTFEYVPYFPKDTDNYYIGNGANVSWVADGALEVKQSDSRETIVSYNDGEDLSSKSANLLKLTYTSLTIRKLGMSQFLQSEWDAIKQQLYNQYGNAEIDGVPSYTGNAIPTLISGHNMTGEFSATPVQTINFTTDVVSNMGVYSSSANVHAFRYPAFTMQPQYYQNRMWIGQQKVQGLEAPAITPYLSLGGGATGMHGFAYDAQGQNAGIYDPDENAFFMPVQILRKVEGITCPITG